MRKPAETDTASNVSMPRPVPTTLDTDTAVANESDVRLRLSARHTTLVRVDHAVVEQTSSANAAVDDATTVPKFKPISVSDVRPERAELSCTDETTVPSKLNEFEVVPATPWTVTIVKIESVLETPALHASDEADTHDEVAQ